MLIIGLISLYVKNFSVLYLSERRAGRFSLSALLFRRRRGGENSVKPLEKKKNRPKVRRHGSPIAEQVRDNRGWKSWKCLSKNCKLAFTEKKQRSRDKGESSEPRFCPICRNPLNCIGFSRIREPRKNDQEAPVWKSKVLFPKKTMKRRRKRRRRRKWRRKRKWRSGPLSRFSTN